MTDTINSVEQLQAIADRVVSMAQPGEHIEAYVSRDAETDVRVYEGEVEHFVAAQTEGVGIRVIRDGRTGFAYAGVLDEAAVAEVLAEARDNPTPDKSARDVARTTPFAEARRIIEGFCVETEDYIMGRFG